MVELHRRSSRNQPHTNQTACRGCIIRTETLLLMDVEESCFCQCGWIRGVPPIGRIREILNFCMCRFKIIQHRTDHGRVKYLEPAAIARLSIRYGNKTDASWANHAPEFPNCRSKALGVIFPLSSVRRVQHGVIQTNVFNGRYAHDGVEYPGAKCT